MSSSSSYTLRIGFLDGDILDGLTEAAALIGEEYLAAVLLAEEALTGELDLSGDEDPNLTADDGLGGVYGLGGLPAGLRNSANSE